MCYPWVKGRPQVKFYHNPTVDTKCAYQNLEPSHVNVDMVKVGSMISNIRHLVPFVKRTRRETYKTNDSDAQIST